MPDLSPDDIYRHEAMPQSQDEARARHESNRAAWNEGAAMYTAEIEGTIAFLKAGKSNLHPVERSYLAPILPQVKTAIHLQCASGRDTLSLWNEGVPRVIGVDISDVHIANARQITAALNAPAEWHRCDLLDTPHELDGTADLVYTGRGAMCWINDLDGWAGVVTRLLKPGGYLSLFDDHPASWLFNIEAETYQYDNIDFFNHAEFRVGLAQHLHRRPGRPPRAAVAQVRMPVAHRSHRPGPAGARPRPAPPRRAPRPLLGSVPQSQARAARQNPVDVLAPCAERERIIKTLRVFRNP